MRTMAGALWLSLAALGAAAQEPIDGWLPEETLFCLSVEDPPRTAARLARGRYADLRGDPAAQRLAVEAKAFVARAREASHERGEVWLGSFWNVARGPLLLSVVRARGREAPLVVMDAGDAEAFPRHLARLADAGVLGPEALRDYRGETIRARHGGEGSGAVFWTGHGGVVAFSWREDAIEELIDHRRDGGPGVAPRLDAVRGKLRDDADALLLLSREAIGEIERRNSDLSELALPADASLGMTITLDADALDVRVFLFAPRPRKGTLALLDEPNGEILPPPFLGGTFVAARLDLGRVLDLAGTPNDDAPPLARRFVRALGDRFALARSGRDEVFLAEVADEAWMRRLLSALPDAGGGVREGPDGAVAMRDGWLIAAARPAAVLRMLAEPARAPPAASAALPRERILSWRMAPGPPLDWDDPMRLFGAQEGALANDPDGLLLVHRVALR